jgi:cytochrome c peroxidase
VFSLKKAILPLFVVICVLLLSSAWEDERGLFYLPAHWPKPTYDFKNNPLTDEKFLLGKALFYDPVLSVDSTVSCASCHLQYTAFAHVDHALSHGIHSRVGKRNAPGLMNLAWMPVFHWDGGVLNLNAQPVNPITHPDEMGSSLKVVLAKLNGNPVYQKAFKEVFETEKIETHHLMKALAQFTVSLVSANSKYDKVMRKEKGIHFTEQEEAGHRLFQKHCNECHKAPLFTTHEFKANGIGLDPALADFGRMSITQKSKDSLLFKIPTLRNIAYSFPYMHDGRFAKLKDVIQHYATLSASKGLKSKEFSKRPIALNDNQQKDLLAFLKTLSDTEFLFNKKYSFYSLKSK